MSYDAIRSVIMDTRLRSKAKVSEISRMLDRLDELESVVEGLAIDLAKKGKNPLEIMQEIAIRKGVDIKGVDRAKVQRIITEGVNWLRNTRNEDGGWGRWEQEMYPHRIRKIVMKKNNGRWPKELSTPWETAFAMLNFAQWRRNFETNKDALSDEEKSGLQWLQQNQNDDGGWGELSKGEYGSLQSGALHSGISIFPFVEGSGLIINNEFIEGDDVVRKGLNFFLEAQNKRDGGWPLYKRGRSETKSTAIVSTILSILKPSLNQLDQDKTNLALEQRCKTAGEQAVEWLIKKQHKKSWLWESDFKPSPSNVISPTFFAMYALQMFSLSMSAGDSRSTEIAKAIRMARRAYKASGDLSSEDKTWYWKSGKIITATENTAAAVNVLLQCGEKDNSFVIEKGIEWLIKHKHEKEFWGNDTDIVLYCLFTFLIPEMRMVKQPSFTL